jgi:hypothetical protein
VNTVNRLLLAAPFCLLAAAAAAQGSVLLDFNDPLLLHRPLPVDVTAGGITAHLTSTGQGYSIQDTSAPVVPVGFSGQFVYPSSVFAADLIVDFSVTLTAFSTLYAPDELACDDSARMRVTAYRSGVFVGTATTTASNPGTYPVSTLACAFAQGFDRVVIHYDAPPPTCQDYGVIFLVDDMRVTPAPAGSYVALGNGCAGSLPAAQLIATGVPRIGTTFHVDVYRLPTDVAFLFTGASRTTSTFGPLPLDATPFGMPGCTAYASTDAISFLAGAGGVAGWQLAVPNSIAFVGAVFYQQVLVLDPAAPNALGAVLSDAMQATVGQ